jgi:hypothetical protein
MMPMNGMSPFSYKMPRWLNKEVVMERTKIKTYAQKAYTLHLDTSGLSLTEKSNRFARFFAYEIAYSKLPQNGDIAGCIAAHHLLDLVNSDYEYARHREKTAAQLRASRAEYERAIGIVPSRAPVRWVGLAQTTRAHEATRINLHNEIFHENPAVLDTAKTDYIKAYCIAFILFEEATKTQTQQAFESCIENQLNLSFADPYSYSNALFQFMMRSEINTLMAIVLVLGLVALALPSAGFSALSATTTYAIGGSMTASASIYHTWRFFAEPNTPDDTHQDEAFTSPNI